MVIKRDILFTPAQKTRTLHIYLPDEYEKSQERYPVMYFFDGHNLFFDSDATYGKSWGLKEFLDSWEKPIIIVGIECSHEGSQRLSEYCPYTVPGSPWGNLVGTGLDTLRWMAEELKPMIDKEYRTWPHREATGIAGSSMGGLMAMAGAALWNSVFSKAACVSPADSMCERYLRRDLLAAELHPDTRFWLSWGSEETWCGAPTLRMEKVLAGHGVLTRLYEQPEGRHCEADWEKQVPLFMNWLWLDD